LNSGFALAKQVLYCLSHTSRPFCSGYFGDGISPTVCLGWPQTTILLISASQIARITTMNWTVFEEFKRGNNNWVWWYMPVVLTLRKLRQEFHTSLH
jgi:hypothetical protein